jgi:thiamine-phosphate diphosphorylase
VFDLYLITDPRSPLGLVEATRVALTAARPGRVAVQLRAKELSSSEILAAGRELREITSRANALLIVNDRADIAKLIEADGIHLPERGLSPNDARILIGPTAVVGVSRHDTQGLERANAEGATFATLSPFASNPTKGAPLGAARFGVLTGSAQIPVFALGGVHVTNVKEAMASGASGIAVIRAVYASPDPAGAVASLLEELDAVPRISHRL